MMKKKKTLQASLSSTKAIGKRIGRGVSAFAIYNGVRHLSSSILPQAAVQSVPATDAVRATGYREKDSLVNPITAEGLVRQDTGSASARKQARFAPSVSEDDDDVVELSSSPVAKKGGKLKLLVQLDKPKKPKRLRKSLSSVSAKRRRDTDDESGERNGSTNGFTANTPVTSFDSAAEDSATQGRDALAWLVAPLDIATFEQQHFGKEPVLVQNRANNYFKDLKFTSADFNQILAQNDISFTRNIDITSYVDGVRETHNPPGRAYPSVVWDFFDQGCSVRMLNPQTYNASIRRLNAMLQEYFGTFVGANVYLTPAGHQGFAPHWDDIEAFVMQLEGQKHWRVYPPHAPFPLQSSRNFAQDEIGAAPLLDVTLQPGDLLYIPRGYIHQANSPKEVHSLHITLSSMQLHTYGHVVKEVLTTAMEEAWNNDVALRRSLPAGYLDYAGYAHTDSSDARRAGFVSDIQRLCRSVLKSGVTESVIDKSVDKHSLTYIHEALPPVLQEGERARTVFGTMTGRQISAYTYSAPLDRIDLQDDTRIRLIRRNCFRLVLGAEEGAVVYHTLENAAVYKEKELQGFDVDEATVDILRHLLKTYPAYVSVLQLPAVDEERKKDIANMLFDKGLVIRETVA